MPRARAHMRTQGGADVATKTDGAAATTGGVADGGDQQAQLQEDWTAFVKWFRSNGGIISSKLTVKVRECIYMNMYV